MASYKELSKIEESFRVFKSDLEGRPVYLKRADRIEGHFLTCFIALTILRAIEKLLANNFSGARMRAASQSVRAKPYNHGIYVAEPQDEIAQQLERQFKSFLDYETICFEEFKRYQKQIYTTKLSN